MQYYCAIVASDLAHVGLNEEMGWSVNTSDDIMGRLMARMGQGRCMQRIVLHNTFANQHTNATSKHGATICRINKMEHCTSYS
jgi:hypothetical protein